jgi:OmpA-OmpF porin, OOP family
MKRSTILLCGAIAWLILCALCIFTHLDPILAKLRTATPVSPSSTSSIASGLTADYRADKITLRGVVPSEDVKTSLMARAINIYGEGKVINELMVNPNSTDASWSVKALTMLPFAKNNFAATTGSMTLNDRSLTLYGALPSDSAKQAYLADMSAKAGTAYTIVDSLTILASPKKKAEEKLQLDLNKVIFGKTIEFATGSAVILPRSRPILDTVALVMREMPDAKVEVQGHTDNQGNELKNIKLSKDRAASVKAYLRKKGIDASRLKEEGYGSSKPIAGNATPDGRQKNRRINFQVLGGE